MKRFTLGNLNQTSINLYIQDSFFRFPYIFYKCDSPVMPIIAFIIRELSFFQQALYKSVETLPKYLQAQLSFTNLSWQNKVLIKTKCSIKIPFKGTFPILNSVYYTGVWIQSPHTVQNELNLWLYVTISTYSHDLKSQVRFI